MVSRGRRRALRRSSHLLLAVILGATTLTLSSMSGPAMSAVPGSDVPAAPAPVVVDLAVVEAGVEVEDEHEVRVGTTAAVRVTIADGAGRSLVQAFEIALPDGLTAVDVATSTCVGPSGDVVEVLGPRGEPLQPGDGSAVLPIGTVLLDGGCTVDLPVTADSAGEMQIRTGDLAVEELVVPGVVTGLTVIEADPAAVADAASDPTTPSRGDPTTSATADAGTPSATTDAADPAVPDAGAGDPGSEDESPAESVDRREALAAPKSRSAAQQLLAAVPTTVNVTNLVWPATATSATATNGWTYTLAAVGTSPADNVVAIDPPATKTTTGSGTASWIVTQSSDSGRATLTFTVGTPPTGTGWSVSAATCTVNGVAAATTVYGNTISVSGVAPADAVSCTVTNRQALVCPGNVFTIDGTGIASVPVPATGAVAATTVATGVPASTAGPNALAVTPEGRAAYFNLVGLTTTALGSYIPGTAPAFTAFGATLGLLSASAAAGAINPVNGNYFYGGVSGGNVYMYNPTTGVNTQIGSIPGLGLTTGDYAFTATGDLLIQNSALLGGNGSLSMVAAAALPSTTSNASLTTTSLTSSTQLNGDGIAFGIDGSLYVKDGSTLRRLNAATGAQIGATATLSGVTGMDLASCYSGSTIRVRTEVAGRVLTGDQFALSVTGGLGSTTPVATTGAATGLQTVTAGPVLGQSATAGVTGPTYTVTQAASGSTVLTRYQATYRCEDIANNNALLASGTGMSFTFSLPTQVSPAVAPVNPRNVVCTFSTTTFAPNLALAKANPASLMVNTASTYALTVTNSGNAAATTATVVDILPPNVVYTSATGATCAVTGGSVAAGQVVTCTVPGPIAATGGTAAVGITVTPNPIALATSVVNRAAVDVLAGTSPATTCTANGTPAGCAVTPALTVGGQPFSCAGTVYRSSGTAIVSFPTAGFTGTTGALVNTAFANLPTATLTEMNALGINRDGTRGYIVGQTIATPATTQIVVYTAGTASPITVVPTGLNVLQANRVAGAVNPANGLFYFGGPSSNAPIYRYDPVANTTVQVGLAPGSTGAGNGDFAFSANGDLFIINNTSMILVPAASVPTTGATPNVQLVGTPVLGTGALPEVGNGAAFGEDGSLYLQAVSDGPVRRINPNTGATLAQRTTGNFTGGNDLATCGGGPTLQIRKSLTARAATGDQFALTIAIPGATTLSTITTGTAIGVQPAVVTASAVSGTTYTLSETPSGTTVMGRYRSTYSCVDTAADNEVVATGSTTSFSYTFPPADGQAVVCTFTNELLPTGTGTGRPLQCNTIWGVAAGSAAASPVGNSLYSVDPTTGAASIVPGVGTIATTNVAGNLGTAAIDGRTGRLFAIDNTIGPRLMTLAPGGTTWTQATTVPGTAGANLWNRLAMDGSGNLYGSQGSAGTNTLYRWAVGLDGTVGAPVTVTLTPAITVRNGGDLAVSPAGRLFYALSNSAVGDPELVYEITGAFATGTTATATLLATSQAVPGVLDLSGIGFFNGLLYGSNSTAPISSFTMGLNLTPTPATWPAGAFSVLPTTPAIAMADLATCGGTATVQFAKVSQASTGTFALTGITNLANNVGTVVTTDSITTTAPGTATTSPNINIVTTLNQPVTATETVPTGWALAGASCVDSNAAVTGNPASFGAVTSGSQLTVPAANVRAGAAIVCTYTNGVVAPVLSAAKTLTGINGVAPAAGAQVRPGDRLTYTITGSNAGNGAGNLTLTETVPTGTTFTAPAGSWIGCAVGAVAGTTCTQTIPVPAQVGGTPGTATAVFEVTVLSALPAPIIQIQNVVAATGPGGANACATPASCTVTTSVVPSWTMTKAAAVGGTTLAAGAVVRPGQTITWTVTATATRGTVQNLVIIDDLVAVLPAATFGSASVVVAGGAPQAVPLSGAALDKLTVQVPTLTAPQLVTLTYTATVRSGAYATTIANSATGSATVPPDRCAAGVSPNPCVTQQITPVFVLLQKLIDGLGGPTPVNGATFELRADQAGVPGPVITDPAIQTTAAVGTFQIAGLAPGTYWLRETVAPTGHNLLAKDVAFTVVMPVGGTASLTVATGNPQVTVAVVGGTPTLRVLDTEPFALPFAGGSGTSLIRWVGLLLMGGAVVFAALLLVRRRQLGVVRQQ